MSENDSYTGDSERFDEDEILDELERRGIARPVGENHNAGGVCKNDGCDNTVPEPSRKSLNLGASDGFCNLNCKLEWEEKGARRRTDTDQ